VVVDRSSSLLIESSSSAKSHPVVGRRLSSYANASTIVDRSRESSSEGDVRKEGLLSSCLRRPNLTDCRRLHGRTALLLVGAAFVVCNRRGLGTSPLRPEENVLVFRIMTVVACFGGFFFFVRMALLCFGGGVPRRHFCQRDAIKVSRGEGAMMRTAASSRRTFTSSDDLLF
jgi:hypothetical protein